MTSSPSSASRARFPVEKTYKLYIGGAFVGSGSGTVTRVKPADRKEGIARVCRASREDFQEAVVAARGAFATRSGASAAARGQILYRAAEMLEVRGKEMAREIVRCTSATPSAARREVHAAADALVHYAGWTDKLSAVFGSVNPVSSPHFNFTYPEPMGVVVIFCPDMPSLVPLVHLLAAATLTGNTCVVLASETAALPGLGFGEVLAMSDFPRGVVNILAGRRAELAAAAASHMDVNAIVNGCDEVALDKTLHEGTALNLKRYARRPLSGNAWSEVNRPQWILDTTECKTVWHPIGW